MQNKNACCETDFNELFPVPPYINFHLAKLLTMIYSGNRLKIFNFHFSLSIRLLSTLRSVNYMFPVLCVLFYRVSIDSVWRMSLIISWDETEIGSEQFLRLHSNNFIHYFHASLIRNELACFWLIIMTIYSSDWQFCIFNSSSKILTFHYLGLIIIFEKIYQLILLLI